MFDIIIMCIFVHIIIISNMAKVHKHITLDEQDIVSCNKICNIRDKNFSRVIGELINEEITRHNAFAKCQTDAT